MAAKNGTAADPKSGKGNKKKTGELVGQLVQQNAKLLDRLEQLGQAGGSGSGINPARLFAEVKDPVIERQAGFKSPREFLSAVITAGSGKGLDKRLEPLRTKTAGTDEGQTQAGPLGGFLIPVGFIPEPLKVDPEADPMGAATTKIPMENPIVTIPARVDKNHTTSVSGGLVVGRKAETLTVASSRQSYEQVTLEAHTLFGLSFATEELLTDSPMSFAAIIQAGFDDQFTYHLINERLNGTGVGEYMGVMNCPCLITINKETNQPAATLTFDNVIKMRSRCWRYGRAIWLANHDTAPQLMTLNQQIGVGGVAVWQPSAREDHPDILLGRPLVFTEYCQTLGTKGDLVLGVWAEYLEGQYQPMQQEESIHVRFVEHERTFKVWVRNAGQPWWTTALTPKFSANTLSPFVVLQTRS